MSLVPGWVLVDPNAGVVLFGQFNWEHAFGVPWRHVPQSGCRPCGNTIRGFDGSDVIDVPDVAFATIKPLSYIVAIGKLVVSDAHAQCDADHGRQLYVDEFLGAAD
jgi:hypothetical protein